MGHTEDILPLGEETNKCRLEGERVIGVRMSDSLGFL
jgi:hypothetical protein